jgi:hypothetical protein
LERGKGGEGGGDTILHDPMGLLPARPAEIPGGSSRLAVLDLGLAKLNGYDACHHIREQPWGKAICIVAITGWGQEDDRRRSQEADFDQHMVKGLAGQLRPTAPSRKKVGPCRPRGSLTCVRVKPAATNGKGAVERRRNQPRSNPLFLPQKKCCPAWRTSSRNGALNSRAACGRGPAARPNQRIGSLQQSQQKEKSHVSEQLEHQRFRQPHDRKG